ncbi:MAG: dephospho-CoA kinase [Pseudomonadota bacterium]
MSYKVGLTGGIGSGKSAAADCFRRLDVMTIDADQVVHDLYRPGSSVYSEIIERFGAEAKAIDGSIDRQVVRNIVFSDAAQKDWLEQLVHPEIRQQMHSRADHHTGPYCVLEIPLLIESGQEDKFDRILVVQSPEELRWQRVESSRDLTESEFRKIASSQASDDQRLTAADDIIVNDGTLVELCNKVALLHQDYLRLSSQLSS